MMLEIQSGSQAAGRDGLYVVFVECAVTRGWTEPHIVLRKAGRWLHRNSEMPYLDQVHAWIALPPMSKEMIRDIEIDPDLGRISEGHICKRGIRWPHACQPSDAAYALHKDALDFDL